MCGGGGVGWGESESKKSDLTSFLTEELYLVQCCLASCDL